MSKYTSGKNVEIVLEKLKERYIDNKINLDETPTEKIEDLFKGTPTILIYGDTFQLDITQNGRISVGEVYLNKELQLEVTNISYKNSDILEVYDMKFPEDSSDLYKSSKLTSFIAGSSIDTRDVISLKGCFQSCLALLKLELNYFYTPNLTNINSFIYSSNRINEIDLSSWFVPKYVDVENMFRECTMLTSIKLPKLKCTTNAYMFYGCLQLDEVNIENLDTTYSISMHGMFTNCSSLVSGRFDTLNTTSCKTMLSMFYGCEKIERFDLPNFVTPNVMYMAQMFLDCKSATEILLPNLTGESLTGSNGSFSMFRGCNSATKIDIGKFTVGNSTSTSMMFYNCYALKDLIWKNLGTSKVTIFTRMFNGCSSLLEVDATKIDFSNGITVNTVFSNCEKLKNIIGLKDINVSKATSLASFFSSCLDLEMDIDLSNWDTSKVTTFSSFLYRCRKVKSINVKGKFSTVSATSLSHMFRGTSVTELDLSNFITTKVTTADYMFYECSSLKKLIITNFVLTGTTNYMFNSTPNLTEVYYDGIKSTQATIIKLCTSDGGLNLVEPNKIMYTYDESKHSGLSYAKVTFKTTPKLSIELNSLIKTVNMSNMFNCNQWIYNGIGYNDDKDIPVTNGGTLVGINVVALKSYAKTNNFNNKFTATGIKSIVGAIDFRNCTDTSYLFAVNKSMTTLNLEASTNTKNITSFRDFVAECSSLTTLKINTWDVTGVKNMRGCFYFTNGIQTIDFSKLDLINVTDWDYFLSACSATTVYLNKARFDRGTYTSAFGNKCTKLYLNDASQTLASINNASMMATENAKTIYVKDASKHSGLSYTNVTYAYA